MAKSNLCFFRLDSRLASSHTKSIMATYGFPVVSRSLILDLAAALLDIPPSRLCLQPAFDRTFRRFGRAAGWRGRPVGFEDEFFQPLARIVAIAVLGAEFGREDDDHAVLGQPAA